MASSASGTFRGVGVLSALILALAVVLASAPGAGATPSRPASHSSARLVYSTFLGGSAFDEATNNAVDRSGHVYVTGRTFSDDLPTTPGAFDQTPNGAGDVFVAKLSPDGSSLEYATYLGGSGEDVSAGVAVDDEGRAYVVGTTGSADFPTTNGRGFAGGADVFVARLSPDGRRLDSSTLLGGASLDVGLAIALDTSEQAYLTGYTASPNFPTTPGAFDPTFSGGAAFVTKLRPDGSTLAYSTFLGSTTTSGFLTDQIARSIAVGRDGQAYVTGFTRSMDFPTTPGAFDTTPSEDDVFVTKLSRDGSTLVYSTVVGSGDATDLAIDAAGRATLVGVALAGFPTTPDALDPSFDEFFGDAFVAQLSRDGSQLLYGSFLGGSAPDSAQSVAMGPDGHTYIAGFTASADFPLTPDAIDTERSDFEGFLVRLGRDKTRLVFGTLLGGSDADIAFGVAVDRRGSAYLVGQTFSADFVTTPGAAQTVHAGDADAFISKIGEL